MLFDKFKENLDELINYNFPNLIGLCVSGGADSLALLYLIDQWNIKYNLPIEIFTVNHNLREESIAECDYVNEIAIKLNYKCTILNWHPNGNYSNIQARARKGRYDLITAICKEKNIDVIFTGHHLDDYLENLFLRQKRKSGEFGLSSSNIHYYNNIKIVRPLNNFYKNDLLQYLENKNVRWVEDLSNFSDKYDRTKIRNYFNKLADFAKEDIVKQQKEINNHKEKLKWTLVSAFAQTCAISVYGVATFNLELFISFPYVIKLQLLSYILTIIGAKDHTPRGRSVELILNLISESDIFTNSLHGCSVSKKENQLIIIREFGIDIPTIMVLKEGIIWDNRFLVKNSIMADECYITYLKHKEYVEIKNEICLDKLKVLYGNKHKKILFTLPIIKKFEKIIAIPHISYYNKCTVEEIKLLFHPQFISRFIHLI